MKSYVVEMRGHCFICREKKLAHYLLKKSVGRVLKYLKRSEAQVLQRISRKVLKAPVEVLRKLQRSNVLEVEVCQSCWNAVNEFEASFGILEELERRVAANYEKINDKMKKGKETVEDSRLGMMGSWELEVVECVRKEIMGEGIEGSNDGESVRDDDGMELGADAESMNEEVDVWTIDDDPVGLPRSDATLDSDMEQDDDSEEVLSDADLGSCSCLSSGSERMQEEPSSFINSEDEEKKNIIKEEEEVEKKIKIKVETEATVLIKDACPAEIPILPEDELFREWSQTKEWPIDKLPHKSYAPLLQGKRFRVKYCSDPKTGYTSNCPCGRRFAHKGLLENHLLLKYYGLVYHCEYCDNRFLREVTLQAHQKRCYIKLSQHKVDLIKCKGCSLSFYLKEDLLEHVWLNHPKLVR